MLLAANFEQIWILKILFTGTFARKINICRKISLDVIQE